MESIKIIIRSIIITIVGLVLFIGLSDITDGYIWYVIFGLMGVSMLYGLKDLLFGKSSSEVKIDELERLIRYLEFLLRCGVNRIKVYKEGSEFYSIEECYKELDEKEDLLKKERGNFIMLDVFGNEETNLIQNSIKEIYWYGGDKIKYEEVKNLIVYLRKMIIECEDKIEEINKVL